MASLSLGSAVAEKTKHAAATADGTEPPSRGARQDPACEPMVIMLQFKDPSDRGCAAALALYSVKNGPLCESGRIWLSGGGWAAPGAIDVKRSCILFGFWLLA